MDVSFRHPYRTYPRPRIDGADRAPPTSQQHSAEQITTVWLPPVVLTVRSQRQGMTSTWVGGASRFRSGATAPTTFALYRFNPRAPVRCHRNRAPKCALRWTTYAGLFNAGWVVA